MQKDKIFKIDNIIYPSSLGLISPILYKITLIDENNNVLKSTIGKAVQDIKNDQISYIDIKSSFNTDNIKLTNNNYNELE
jgi:hypothetical protein